LESPQFLPAVIEASQTGGSHRTVWVPPTEISIYALVEITDPDVSVPIDLYVFNPVTKEKLP